MSDPTTDIGSLADTNTPWVERYRPQNLSEVSHQQEVVRTLQNACHTGRLPHLLLYGPAGTGKTSTALALCKELWHPKDMKRRVLELNASDERGIAVVRDKIKHFATLAVGSSSAGVASTSKSTMNSFFQTKTTNDGDDDNKYEPMDTKTDETEKKYPNPPFKIIILDEADTVTPDAQAALRRIIEAHSRITRFILICNYVTRIIEPLVSRCAKFRFQPLPSSSMKARLMQISTKEKCQIGENQLDDILTLCQGDMRRAVTTLQSAHALGETIDSDTIAEMTGLPPAPVVDALWKACGTNVFATMQEAVEDTCASGYSAQAILAAMCKITVSTTELNELSKAKLSLRIAESEKKLVDGADECLQLMTVCSLALQCLEESKLSKQ